MSKNSRPRDGLTDIHATGLSIAIVHISLIRCGLRTLLRRLFADKKEKKSATLHSNENDKKSTRYFPVFILMPFLLLFIIIVTFFYSSLVELNTNHVFDSNYCSGFFD